MLTSSSGSASWPGRPGLNDPNRRDSVNDQLEKVLVCSQTLEERRKLLGYFSRLGTPVILCSDPERAADSFGDDIGLLVVNAFDSDWSVGRWVDVIAQHPDDIPVIFVHHTTSARDWRPDTHPVGRDSSVSLVHVTEAGFRVLCDDGLMNIRARMAARRTYT